MPSFASGGAIRLQSAHFLAIDCSRQENAMAQPPAEAQPSEKPLERRLDSWKEIAAYLNRDVTTVQRWEKREGMPVHRHVHDKRGSVYALTPELDIWLQSRRPSIDVDEKAPETEAPVIAEGNQGSRAAARGHRWLALTVVAAMGLLAAAYLAYRGRTQYAARPTIKSIAVLPLRNLSGDATQEYLADGMTEALIGRLSRISDLRVISRTSVMRFKDSQLSVPEIAKALRVDAIVEGSVIREGSRIRVQAQLIRAATDEHTWSEAYDREFRDVLTLQSDVAQTLAQQIQMQLTPEQQARLRSSPAVNPDAYEAYLKGRFYEDSGTRSALKQAQGYYEDAVRKDPTFALAYVGLADCYLEQGSFRLVSPQDAYRQGSVAIQKALQLGQALGEAHGSLGYLDWRYEWNWQQAERELRYAIELNPNSLESHETLVWYFSWSGRREEALAEVEKIRQLDPAYPFIPLQQSGIYYHQRDYKSLVEAGEESVAGYPNGWQSHYFLAVGYEGSGRRAQAIPEYHRAFELSEGDTDTKAALAHAYAAAGRRTEAEKMLYELKTQSKIHYVSPYMIGVIYAALQNKEKAFEFLEKAYEEKSPDVAYFLKADLRIDSLRSDLRFQDLLHRMNFPQ
jgi:TolB-like protein/Tfp pilus assembly protein PilF